MALERPIIVAGPITVFYYMKKYQNNFILMYQKHQNCLKPNNRQFPPSRFYEQPKVQKTHEKVQKLTLLSQFVLKIFKGCKTVSFLLAT